MMCGTEKSHKCVRTLFPVIGVQSIQLERTWGFGKEAKLEELEGSIQLSFETHVYSVIEDIRSMITKESEPVECVLR